MQVDLGLHLETLLQGYSSEQPTQDGTDYTSVEGRAPLSLLNPQHLTETRAKQVLRRDSWMNE